MDRRSDPVLVHFYRAVITHMDVWRQRMDATTNWAAATAATAAGMITFAFGSPPILRDFVASADVAFVPGSLVLGGVALFVGGLLILAARAPSEDMLDWVSADTLWVRWTSRMGASQPGDPRNGEDQP